jgi:hypothetical protein
VIPVLGQRILPTPLFWGSVALLLTLLVRWWHRGRRTTDNFPTKWQCVGELSELTLFPVKSFAGISLQEAECTECGIQTVTDGPLKLRDRFVPNNRISIFEMGMHNIYFQKITLPIIL